MTRLKGKDWSETALFALGAKAISTIVDPETGETTGYETWPDVDVKKYDPDAEYDPGFVLGHGSSVPSPGDGAEPPGT